MKFGDILEQWDSFDKAKTTRAGRHPQDLKNSNDQESSVMSWWLDTHTIVDKDSRQQEEPKDKGAKGRQRMRKLNYQASLDLHGYSLAGALQKLHSFIAEARHKGLKKVLIIHGKGNHSQGKPVLRAEIREAVKQSRFVGEIGTPPEKDGGNGATWIILR